MTDQAYVHHKGIDAYAWIPRTALSQHILQGWVETDPPPPPPPPPSPPAGDDNKPPASPAGDNKSTRRGRGTQNEEND